MNDPKTIAAVNAVLRKHEDIARREHKRYYKEKRAKFFQYRNCVLSPAVLELIYSEAEDTLKDIRDEITKLPQVKGDVSEAAAELSQIRGYLEKNLPELMKSAGKKARISDVIVAILESKTK